MRRGILNFLAAASSMLLLLTVMLLLIGVFGSPGPTIPFRYRGVEWTAKASGGWLIITNEVSVRIAESMQGEQLRALSQSMESTHDQWRAESESARRAGKPI